MDELLEEFNSSLKTQHFDRGEPQPQPDDKKSDFENLYKNWGKLGNQEERRRAILEVQKSNRNNNLDAYRGILEIVQAGEEKEIFGSDRKAHYRPTIYVAGFHKVSSYSNVLMMSEWLIEKPEDLHENWFVVPCPKGVRMIVVANQGITKCYTKFGHFRFQMRTALPGGNPCDPKRRDRCTVLDCFYYNINNTMYILDLLAWTQPMTDGEAEFRHFWLESQLAEIPELKKISKKNETIFQILPKTSCTPEGLNKVLQTYPMFDNDIPPLDGLLFYHKRASYVSGETPLVGWLFPYMVPEVLGADIAIHNFYSLQKPKGYVNQADFIQKFEAKAAQKGKRRSKSSAMDTTDESEEANNSKSDNTAPAEDASVLESSEMAEECSDVKSNKTTMESEDTEKVSTSNENNETKNKVEKSNEMDAQNADD